MAVMPQSSIDSRLLELARLIVRADKALDNGHNYAAKSWLRQAINVLLEVLVEAKDE